MKFPMDRPVKVVMLGAGGTGGYVAPYVFRLLHMLGRPARFIICDGDIVEPKNLDRQNFVPADLGENKARVLAERYSTVLRLEWGCSSHSFGSISSIRSGSFSMKLGTYSVSMPRTVE